MLDDEFIPASSLKIKESTLISSQKNKKTRISIDRIWKKVKLGRFEYGDIKKINWKDFEAFCSYILRNNGFQCINNVRFRCNTKKRYEIDIIARSKLLNVILSIDAKHWKIGGRAKIITAAKNQMWRTKNFLRKCEKIFNHDINIEKIKKYKVIPAIITLNSEIVFLYKGVPIIPLEKLNDFLQKFDGYLDSFKIL